MLQFLLDPDSVKVWKGLENDWRALQKRLAREGLNGVYNVECAPQCAGWREVTEPTLFHRSDASVESLCRHFLHKTADWKKWVSHEHLDWSCQAKCSEREIEYAVRDSCFVYDLWEAVKNTHA